MAGLKDAAIERGRKYAAAGQFDQAIEACRQVLDKALDDAGVYEAIGDIYIRKKANKEATEAYQKAAQLFLLQGVHPQSIAVYKKILKIEPSRADLHTQVGELYAVEGLQKNAVAEYLAAAKLYLKAEKNVEALSLFRKVSEFDPHNTSVRMQVAEICLKERRIEEAVEEYLRIGDEYRRLQKDQDERALYEKALTLSPHHHEVRRRLELAPPLESDIPEVAVPALETTLREEVQGGSAQSRKAEEGIEFDFAELEASMARQSAQADVQEIELEPTSLPVGAVAGTIEFNPVELESPGIPAAVEGTSAATPAEALRLLEAADGAQAERVIRTLLLSDPEKNEYLAVLGLVYLQKGDVATAYEILLPIIKTWIEEKSP